MPLRMETPLPSLEGVTDWFNSEPIKDADLKDKPVLIHFWSISCHNCKESLPEMNDWVDEFSPLGLEIISVHMPRSQPDTDIEKVKESVDEYKMKQPCAVDNWHEIVDRFDNKFVPSYYLFDKEHKLRHFQAGEKAIKMVKPVVERVLNAQGVSE